MSTRGFIGFKDMEGNVHGWYNHFDSYPSGVGTELVTKLCSYTHEQLHNFFTNKLKLVNQNEGGGDKIYENHKNILEEDWTAKKSFKLQDGTGFHKDGLFCEYAYIYNLKTKRLELYAGFGKTPTKGNEDWFYEAAHDNNKRYYVRKKGSIKLSTETQKTVELMFKRYGKSAT